MKAKDLLNASKTSHEEGEEEEEDQVAAAYESISKRLEGIRNGSQTEDESEEALDKPIFSQPKTEDEEEEKDSEAEGDEEIEDEQEEDDEEEVDENDARPKKTFEHEEKFTLNDKKEDKEEDDEVIDPLDDESVEEDKKAEEDEKEFDQEPEERHPLGKKEELDDDDDDDITPKPTFNPRQNLAHDDTPESLDDLADEKRTNPSFSSRNIDMPQDEGEDEFAMHIPNLRSNQHPQSFGGADDTNYEQRTTPPAGFRPSNDFFNSPGSGMRRPKKASIWHIVALILIGIAVIGGTVFLLKSQFGGDKESTTSTPAPTQAATPTPSPTPQAIDRSKFKLRVLNGTSKAGLAGTTADKLKALGYQIDKTGNATNSAFLRTIIRAKSGDTQLIDQLVKDLSANSLDASSSGSLKDSDSSDAEIIIGAK